jgi:AcrR family transcriptional regulator
MTRRPARRGYHHGDLRRALLDAAIPLIRKGGPEALTLRAVARAAGVSQTAPYRHFADRAALVAAVADQGFQRLHVRLLEAVKAPEKTTGRSQQTARGGLQAIAVAYVQFALDHPDEYRVMFGGEIIGAQEAPASRGKVFAFLREGISMLQRRSLVRDGDPQAMALTSWALVHGLVMLVLDGQVTGKQAPTPVELTLHATELIMFGMARPA